MRKSLYYYCMFVDSYNNSRAFERFSITTLLRQALFQFIAREVYSLMYMVNGFIKKDTGWIYNNPHILHLEPSWSVALWRWGEEAYLRLWKTKELRNWDCKCEKSSHTQYSDNNSHYYLIVRDVRNLASVSILCTLKCINLHKCIKLPWKV